MGGDTITGENAWARAEVRLTLAEAARPDLSSTAKLLLALIRYHDAGSEGCFASIKTLGREIGGRKQDAVMEALKLLERTGHILIERASGRRNVIRVSRSLPVASTPPVASRPLVAAEPPHQWRTSHRTSGVQATGVVASTPPASESGSELGTEKGRQDLALRVFSPQSDDGKPDLFVLFWELFRQAGVPLNDRDKEKALRLWLNYEPPEHEQIIRWVVAEMKSTWSDAKHTPRPASALQSEGWRRTAAPRTIPTPHSGGVKDAAPEIEARLRENLARRQRR